MVYHSFCQLQKANQLLLMGNLLNELFNQLHPNQSLSNIRERKFKHKVACNACDTKKKYMDLVAILLKFVIFKYGQVFLEKKLIHYRKLENQRRSLCLILDNIVLIRLRLVRIQILLLKYLHYRTFPESQGLRVKIIFGSAFIILVECNKTCVGKN